MSASAVFDRLYAAGFGVSVNRWAGDPDYIVVLWRDGHPVASAHDAALAAALVAAEASL